MQNLDRKRPIDNKRESGGTTQVGDNLDGAIVEMTEVNGRLFVIKERSIYEMITADDIDPERTNISIPNYIPKLVIDLGSESEMVSRTFLTAKNLFKTEYIETIIDFGKVQKLSVEIVQELSILDKEIREYLEQEKIEISHFEERQKQEKPISLPSIINLESTCKTIFQKADHVEQVLMEIIVEFYPNEGLTKQSHFPIFYDVLQKLYGTEDNFSDFVMSTLNIMKIIRELRNGLDHRLKTTDVRNFEFLPSSEILLPTIELDSRNAKMKKSFLSQILPILEKNLISIIEVTFTYLTEKHLKKNIFGYQVREIPIEKRKYKFVNYCVWSQLGKDGFYNQ